MKKQGVCHLCGENKKLSKEHIPPKSAGNKETKGTKISFQDYFDSESVVKGKPFQGGVVFYCFCGDCNNSLTKYVRAYKEWFKVGCNLILQQSKFKGIEVQVKDVSSLKILKHILSMFLGVNDILSKESELVNFIKNEKSVDLSDRFRVFTYLNRESKLRYIPLTSIGDLKTNSSVLCSEITFSPFGYVLIIDSPEYQNDLLSEITSFKKTYYDIKYNVTLPINLLQTDDGNLPIPLNYV